MEQLLTRKCSVYLFIYRAYLYWVTGVPRYIKKIHVHSYNKSTTEVNKHEIHRCI